MHKCGHAKAIISSFQILLLIYDQDSSTTLCNNVFLEKSNWIVTGIDHVHTLGHETFPRRAETKGAPEAHNLEQQVDLHPASHRKIFNLTGIFNRE